MNILLTSVGRRSYMVKYFKEALKNKGIVYASNSKMTYALTVADDYVITPQIYDKSYIPFLIDFCIKNKIKAIIPLFDVDLPVLSLKKNFFEKRGITVVVSDYKKILNCNDKWESYNFLRKNGFDVPLTFKSIISIKYALKSGKIKFPLFVKPRRGMGSIGVYEAENIKELEVFYSKCINKINTTYLKFESEYCRKEPVIFQEKISGDEYGIDVLNDLKGNFLSSVCKLKIDIREGETYNAVIVKDDYLIELGKKLSQKLAHIGNLDVDCIKKSGKYYIIDLNCRFGGQYPFSHLAGVNFPGAIINMLNGETPDESQLIPEESVIGFKDILPVRL